MNTTMEWIKKNWIWITVALVVIAIIVGIITIRKKEKERELVIKLPKMPKMPGMAGRGSAPAGESSASVKAKLDECYKGLANVKLNPNVQHPCASLQDAYEAAKKSESSYMGELKNPLVDMATGQDGLAMLNERGL